MPRSSQVTPKRVTCKLGETNVYAAEGNANGQPGMVLVWHRGGTVGWYKLSRFDGGKLTGKTLHKLLTGE